MKNKNYSLIPWVELRLSSILNFKHWIWILPLFFFACSEKQQPTKDFIEIDMVPLIEGEAQKMPSKIREILYIGDTYCYDKATKETNKYFLTYGENDWGISPDAFFEPRSLVEDKYLVDWESSGHGNNAVLVLVEPKG